MATERSIGLQHFSMADAQNRRTARFVPEIHGYVIPEDRGIKASVLREQLDQVAALQSHWDSNLGIRRKSGEFSNYEPVFARWRYERAQTEREKEIFRIEEIQNIQTALRERNHSAVSELTLSIDGNGKIREAHHAHEPWEDVIERGRVYRTEHGSRETLREQAEVDGFKKIQAHLTDPQTQIGAMDIIISRPGLEGGAYPDNYIDFYRKAIDEKTGVVYIEYTRFISPLNEAQTESIIRGIDSTYFDEENLPRDAWYLQKPISIASGTYATIMEGFGDLFERDTKAMQEAEFQSLWRLYIPAVLHYLDVLTQPDFHPLEIAKAWNTVLLSTENEELKRRAQEITVFIATGATKLDDNSRRIMGAMSDTYGYDKPKKINGGCGSSEGTDINKNSVAQFSGECAKIKCGGHNCDWEADDSEVKSVQSGDLTSCPKCGWKP